VALHVWAGHRICRRNSRIGGRRWECSAYPLSRLYSPSSARAVCQENVRRMDICNSFAAASGCV
jgi:hypothetical protein